jgi:flagellar hook-associated protein 2
MSTSATSSFTGQSEFSSQLQTVITDAVATAQIPITQLQNTQSTITGEQSELQTLGNDFQSLQSSLDAINSAIGTGAYTATLDNTALGTATVGTDALAGTYSVNVASLGSHTNAVSQSTLPTVSDPSTGNISTSSTFTLSVNGSNYSLTPASTSLDSLVSAINGSGANVQATVVNVGGSSAPNYQLSIQGTDYAPDTIQLSAGSTNLLSTISAGSYVTYQVNGEPSTPINSSSRNLSLSTGLTLNVAQTGTANVTVAQSTDTLSSALSNFATAYNTATSDLAKNRGQNGGALAGQTIVDQLGSALESIANYSSSSGSIHSLSDLGLTFDTSGNLNFDASALNASTSLSAVDSFLGTEAGGGFLQSADSTLTALTDGTTGTITLENNSLATEVTNLQTQITNKQTQLTQMQSNLTQQMATADAAISSLEQQQNQITDLFAAETLQSQNYNNG